MYSGGGGAHIWPEGTGYGAIDGPRGTSYGAALGPGGPPAAPWMVRGDRF